MGTKECILSLLLLWFFSMTPTTQGIKIAAFNVYWFGGKKLEDKSAMCVIAQIVRQDDIILIQEMRGVDLDVPKGLLEWLNDSDFEEVDNLGIDEEFVRLLDVTQKTTTEPNKNPQSYDGIYFAPPHSCKQYSIVLNTYVQIDNFGLSQFNYLKKVRDHYPVYVEMNIGTPEETSRQYSWRDSSWDEVLKPAALIKQLQDQSSFKKCPGGMDELQLAKNLAILTATFEYFCTKL